MSLRLYDLEPRKDPKGGSPKTPIPTPLSDYVAQIQPPVLLNTNTYISFGMLILMLGVVVSFWRLADTISANKVELNNRMEKLEIVMGALQKNKNSWTATDQFRWAVHLQQANPQIKVPEPEVDTK